MISAFERSPAELFFRASDDGQGGVETGVHLSRYPNKGREVSASASLSDWAEITAVENDFDIKVSGVNETRIQGWKKEEENIWIHGLWTWNWADSHRKVTAINVSAGTLTVAHDDSKDRDTLPIKVAATGEQGGFVYAENIVCFILLSSLDFTVPDSLYHGPA